MLLKTCETHCRIGAVRATFERPIARARPAVTDHRNDAGNDRRNGASWKRGGFENSDSSLSGKAGAWVGHNGRRQGTRR